MAFHRGSKAKPKSTRSPILVLVAAVTVIALLFLFSSFLSTTASKSNLLQHRQQQQKQQFEKYLYWGTRIDCPGKHCGSCEGLGHQESSLRCALEEAIFLRRQKFRRVGTLGLLRSRQTTRFSISTYKGPELQILIEVMWWLQNFCDAIKDVWDASSCAMDSLYDTEFMSGTVPVILDNSKEWYRVLSTSMKLGARGVVHVEGISRFELKENSRYSDLFMECKDRNNRSAIMLPYSFLPSMAAGKLRDAAEKEENKIVMSVPENGWNEDGSSLNIEGATTTGFWLEINMGHRESCQRLLVFMGDGKRLRYLPYKREIRNCITYTTQFNIFCLFNLVSEQSKALPVPTTEGRRLGCCRRRSSPSTTTRRRCLPLFAVAVLFVGLFPTYSNVQNLGWKYCS
ncbi:hypothetical protein CR513_23674, partial [Mucuna pruriens]